MLSRSGADPFSLAATARRRCWTSWDSTMEAAACEGCSEGALRPSGGWARWGTRVSRFATPPVWAAGAERQPWEPESEGSSEGWLVALPPRLSWLPGEPETLTWGLKRCRTVSIAGLVCGLWLEGYLVLYRQARSSWAGARPQEAWPRKCFLLHSRWDGFGSGLGGILWEESEETGTGWWRGRRQSGGPDLNASSGLLPSECPTTAGTFPYSASAFHRHPPPESVHPLPRSRQSPPPHTPPIPRRPPRGRPHPQAPRSVSCRATVGGTSSCSSAHRRKVEAHPCCAPPRRLLQSAQSPPLFRQALQRKNLFKCEL